MDKRGMWQKYCGFFEKTFSQQLEDNETQLEMHLDNWRMTSTADLILNGREAKGIDNFPITSFSDYPFLTEFGREIEEKVAKVPRPLGESPLGYYKRILPEHLGRYTGYLLDAPYMAAKTTGTTGNSKWGIWGKKSWDRYYEATISSVLMSCAESWGESVILDRKVNALSLVAPIPYLSGWASSAWNDVVNMVPPMDMTDKVTDMGRRFYMTLKEIERGNKIELAGGSGSFLYMVFKYFKEPEYFYKEALANTSSYIKRLLATLKLLQTRVSGKKYEDIRELMPLKGVVIGSVDARLYASFFEEEFGVEPLNAYGSTEIGIALAGRPDRKKDFFPTLSSHYLEFLNAEDEVKKLHEVSEGEVYELIATPFDSYFVRYKTGDLFKVIDFTDDGMPIFLFEGRVQTTIELRGYFRITDDIMAKALVEAGLILSDKWVVTKVSRPEEHLHIILEREWPLTKKELEKAIFDALIRTSPDFQDYVADFKIDNPSETIRVEFVERGTFVKYSIMKVRQGAPLGQCKPQKLIPPEQYDKFEELRECGHK